MQTSANEQGKKDGQATIGDGTCQGEGRTAGGKGPGEGEEGRTGRNDRWIERRGENTCTVNK